MRKLITVQYRCLSIIIMAFSKYQNNINNFVRSIIRYIAYIKLQDKVRADRFIILVDIGQLRQIYRKRYGSFFAISHHGSIPVKWTD